MILALDLGNHLGWCVRKNNGDILSGYENFTPSKSKLLICPSGKRFYCFEQFLFIMQSKFNEDIQEIVFEDVKRHCGTAPAHIFGGFRSILEKFCHVHDVILHPYGVKTIKLNSVGHGNCTKQDTIQFSSNWLNKTIESDDEADAVAIMYTYLKFNNEIS